MGSSVFEMISADEAQELMKVQMEIDPEKLEHYLNLFDQWISTQKYLQELNFSRLCRRNFLIWAKLDFEKAKSKFVRYCYSALTDKEFVSGRKLTLEMDLDCFKYSYMVPMPKLTPSRYRVSISYTFRPDICDPLKMWRYVALSRKCLDRLSEIMMLVLRINFLDDYQIQKENFLVGLLILMDMRYWRGHLYSRLLNSTFFRFLKFVFQKYPLNVRKVAIINLDSTMEKGVNLCLSILPEKIRSRVVILKNHENMYEHIPKECLPSDYGGDLKSLEEIRDDWTELLLQNRDFLEKIWTVEPTGPIPKEIDLDVDAFGVQGSFRKLNID